MRWNDMPSPVSPVAIDGASLERDDPGHRVGEGTRLVKGHVPVPAQPEDDQVKVPKALEPLVELSAGELRLSDFGGQTKRAPCRNS